MISRLFHADSNSLHDYGKLDEHNCFLFRQVYFLDFFILMYDLFLYYKWIYYSSLLDIHFYYQKKIFSLSSTVIFNPKNFLHSVKSSYTLIGESDSFHYLVSIFH